MKAAVLACLISFAAIAQAQAGDVIYSPRAYFDVPVPQRPPLALRGLSRRSASVLAADACWRNCEAQCGWHFQNCIRVAWLDDCVAHNNACERYCLRQCRLYGGPMLNLAN